MSESLQLMLGLFAIGGAIVGATWKLAGKLARLDVAVERIEFHLGLRNGGGARREPPPSVRGAASGSS